jgi:pimeloyl-ACP methyl ester carboxylesterase
VRTSLHSLSTGLRYHLLEWGHDSTFDHTVVLLHGFLDLNWCWQPVVEAGLQGLFHVVAPSMRGHGDSDWVGPGGYYHFADYLADLEDLLRQVGRARVSLVGHSMGGSVAAYFAGTFPERIFKLVLLEGMGPPLGLQTGPERTATWIREWSQARGRAPSSLESIADAAARIRRHDPMVSVEEAERLARHATRLNTAGQLIWKHDPIHLTTAPYGFEVTVAERFWCAITCPTLLVDGAQSSFHLPLDDLDRRRLAFAHAESVTLEGAGHMMQRHRPRALAELLTRFLTKAGDRAGDR